MNVLVTGATGFVGSAIVKALLRRGHAVQALVRDPEKARYLAQQGATLHMGDMLEPATYQPLVREVDVVINAADELMTTVLTEECIKYGRKLIYMSGC
jgi:uncharacterized protein YbjT (DUF2867 family)